MKKTTRVLFGVIGFLLGYSLVELLRGNVSILIAVMSVIAFILAYLLMIKIGESLKKKYISSE